MTNNVFCDVLLSAIVIRQKKDIPLRKTLRKIHTVQEMKEALKPVYENIKQEGGKKYV